MSNLKLGSTADLMCLFIAMGFGRGASGPEFYEALAEMTGSTPSIGLIYNALDRLHHRGLIKSRLEGPSNSRGGRQRKIFELTGLGAEAAQEYRQAFQRVWPNDEPALVSFGGTIRV